MEKKNQEASGKKSFTESKFSSLGKTAGTFKGIGMKSRVLVNFDNTIAKVDRLVFPEEIGETFLKKSWKLLCYPDYSENRVIGRNLRVLILTMKLSKHNQT